jgi:hypothetical protein
MKAFDGKLYPLRGQFTWESQSVYLGFNYMFERGKAKSATQTKR